MEKLASQLVFPQHFLFSQTVESQNMFYITKYLHHILGVPRHLLIPTPVYKAADNKAPEEVLVITFYLMAGQTSVTKGDTNTHFGSGKHMGIITIQTERTE